MSICRGLLTLLFASACLHVIRNLKYSVRSKFWAYATIGMMRPSAGRTDGGACGPKKKSWGTLTGIWVPHDTRDPWISSGAGRRRHSKGMHPPRHADFARRCAAFGGGLRGALQQRAFE